MEKKKEREGNDAYRSRFNQLTISPSLPPRNVRRFIVSIQNDRTWKRSEGASGTSRQTERERDVRTNPYRFYTSKGNRDFAGARWSTGLMEKRRGGSIRCGMLPETTNIACRLFPRGCNCATHWTVPAAAHALHQRNESFRRKSRIASLRSMTELVSISLSLSSSNDPNLSRLGNLFSTFQRGERGFWTQGRLWEIDFWNSMCLNAITRVGTRACWVCSLKNNRFCRLFADYLLDRFYNDKNV